MGKNHLREIIYLVLWGSLLVNVAYGQTDEAFKARTVEILSALE
jgi:hypothetical protein